jgi:hypothetical protein
MLRTSRDIIDKEHAMNRELQVAHEAAQLHNLTLRRAFQDMGQAVAGISEDAFRNTPPKPLWETITKDSRLRGLGLLMMLSSASLLLIYNIQ